MAIAVQLLLLGGFTTLLIFPLVGDTFQLLTVLSGVFLGLFCVPVSIWLCLSSKNRELKVIFLGLSLSYVLLFFSGLFWFAFPKVGATPLVADAGALLSLGVYVPTLAALIYLWNAHRAEARSGISTFVLFVNASAASVLLVYVFLSQVHSQGDVFSTAVYTLSVLADMAVLTIGSVLAIIKMKDQTRYIFLVISGFYLFCLAGDSISLVLSFGQYTPIIATQDLYDLAIITGGIGLTVYALGNIRVTTVEEVDKKRQDTENSLRDIIMQTPDAICIFDLAGNAMLANHAFHRLIGGRQPEDVGQINLFRDADRVIAGSGGKVARVREGETVVFKGERFRCPGSDGPRFCDATVFPTRGSDGRIASYTAILADISDRKRYEEELARARAQAELYVDLMSHDINNMNQIGIGFLEIALEKIRLSNEEQMLIRKPLNAMLNSAHLIDNVKKIRNANVGILSAELVDLGLLLDEVVRNHKDVPGRDVVIEYAPVPGYRVSANPLLKDVFSNLINNAIKHSTGPVQVRITVQPAVINRMTCYRVSVEDNGPGIPDGIKDTVFSRSCHLQARSSGSGLGLYLVKSLVDSFNGTIVLEDRVQGDRGQGTRIVITLPATEISADTAINP
ncbi:MAG TPA: PAS domain-containing sensor histidine kinase [Methanocella sp.]|jgi:PAS domain S-box-containing protein